MSDKKYVLTLNPRSSSRTVVKLDSLEHRESLLRMLNRAEINASISLFEVTEKELRVETENQNESVVE